MKTDTQLAVSETDKGASKTERHLKRMRTQAAQAMIRDARRSAGADGMVLLVSSLLENINQTAARGSSIERHLRDTIERQGATLKAVTGERDKLAVELAGAHVRSKVAHEGLDASTEAALLSAQALERLGATMRLQAKYRDVIQATRTMERGVTRIIDGEAPQPKA